MEYEKLRVDLPRLSDEAAASLQQFIYALMDAIDQQYYYQIKRYYAHEFMESEQALMQNNVVQDESDDPPF